VQVLFQRVYVLQGEPVLLHCSLPFCVPVCGFHVDKTCGYKLCDDKLRGYLDGGSLVVYAVVVQMHLHKKLAKVYL
jgi:hypothetical protein